MKIIDVQISEQLRTKAKKLPMYKEFIELVDKDKKVQRYYNMKIMLLDAFKWDSTPQGHEYWQSVFDSIEVKQMKFCPQCNTRNKVCFLKVNKNYKCYKCKITFQ
jgi:hypothetical protein